MSDLTTIKAAANIESNEPDEHHSDERDVEDEAVEHHGGVNGK